MQEVFVDSTDLVYEETSVRVSRFSVITRNPDEFLEELENLCKEFSTVGAYFFKYTFEE